MSYESRTNKLVNDAEALKDEAIASVAARLTTAKRDVADVEKTVRRGASDIAEELTAKLKAAGVDTDQLMITARDQASDLQRRLVDEIRDRPMRALGFAALAGVVFGLMSAR